MKYLNKIAVFTISVLTAEIASTYVSDYILSYKQRTNPYVDTLIGMAIVAFVFFPIFSVMNSQLKKAAEHYVKHTKKVAGGATKGVIAAFIFALAILYYFYLRKWYGIDLFHFF